jgi:eukaryotic-like serine/threonine-protein kinase
MVGKTLGHYRILEKIGVGGMGEVYLARDDRLERDVAVKVLPPGALTDKAIRKRLRKEAQALSRVNHPNIETLFEFDSIGDVEYLVVEYVAGTSLSDMLAADPLPEKEIARLGVQLASGLAAAHAHGVVHCDLKPANLRVTPDGRLKILDFGIDMTTQSRSGDQTVAGTLPYMAPEQLQSLPADARTDLFASGAVLYEMATGQRPFREETTTRLIDAILHQPVVPPRALNGRISPELELIIVKCLDKEPENRYQSAQELEVDLRRLTLPKTTESIRIPGRMRARRRIAGLVLTCAVVLAAILVLLNAGGWRDRLLGHGEPRMESLAVLPLANLSGDPQQEYFADGMTDELITELSQICSPKLRVISRASVMRYKGSTRQSTPQIARALGVDAVIEGSVFRADDRVRIRAQLIQGSTGKQLWANSYDRDLRDVLKLQGEVATAIANEIKTAVMPQERERLTSAPPVNPAAYEAYLKGRYEWNKGTEHGWQQARQYFEQAVQIDRNYAPAYSGLADYYWSTDALPPNEAMPKAKQYARKALEIDPNLAEAYTSLGAVQFYADWNWPEAERDFRRALELDAGDVEAHRMYSAYLSAMGRAEEALEESRRAEKLDPVSIGAQVTAGWVFYYARRYDQALDQCREVIHLEPNFPAAHDCLGLSYLGKKEYDEAVVECERAVTLSISDMNQAAGLPRESRALSSPTDWADNDLNLAADLARAYALGGNKAEARKILDDWRGRAKRTYVPPSLFAQIHIALGERKQGLAWLETAYADRDEYLARLKVEPAFDAVRSDPGFQDLMRRLDFPP